MFSEELEKYSWEETTREIYSKTAADVELALSKPVGHRRFYGPDFSGCREIPGTDGRIKPKIYLTKIRENHIDVYPLVYH